MWGHGYVERDFDFGDGLIERVWIKRWRCPCCGTIYTMRPSSHWRRFLAPLKTIMASLHKKLRDGLWLSQITRQRQQYWRRGFNIQSHCHGPAVDLDTLEAEGIMVATNSLIDRAVHLFPLPPYRSFAATAPPGPA